MAHKGIQVTIGLKNIDGKVLHDFPDFNRITPVSRDNLDWSYFVDKHGGWHYDQIAGHYDDDTANNSPPGVWIGMLIVPDAFANEAVALFPSKVTLLTELQCQTFYEQRGHIRDASIKEDSVVLQGIKTKRDLKIVESAEDLNALNPDHPAPGRRRNKLKTWAGFKKERAITIGV